VTTKNKTLKKINQKLYNNETSFLHRAKNATIKRSKKLKQ